MSSTGSPRILFMGSGRFAVPSLEALVRSGYQVVGVVSQPPRPVGRSRVPTPPPAMAAAMQMGLAVQTPVRLRDPGAVAAVASFRPELIVVAAYGQILPRAILDLPPHGCVNIHGSLLPRWRGASPIQAAILAGDEYTGVTLMRMDTGLDTGPILARRPTPIQDDDTAQTLEDRLSRMGADLLLEELPRYLGGSLHPVPQEESLATYAPMIRKEDGLVDWKRPAVAIWRACRAYQPWPGIYSYWRGRLLKILSCSPEGAMGALEPPGMVVSLDGGRGAGVATGSGILRLMEVAVEGGKALPIRDFLIGHRDFVGSRLG